MPSTTIGGGIASGITNAFQIALQDESLNIRRERNEALESVAIDRTEAFRERTDLAEEKFEFTKSMAEQEFEAGQPERDLKKLELEEKRKEALEEAKLDEVLTDEGHIIDMTGTDEQGNPNLTPNQIKGVSVFLDAMNPGRKRNGMTRREVKEIFRRATDVGDDNFEPGGAELLKKVFFDPGVADADNQREFNEAELKKKIEKNPLLGTNEIALQNDKEASVLAESIEPLKATAIQNRTMSREMDEVIKQGTANIKAKREELNRKRAAAIEAIQRARETEESATDIIIKKDPITGQYLAVDKNRPGAQPVKIPSTGFPSQGAVALTQQTQQELESLIAEETMLKGTGPQSAIVAFTSRVFGPFIPGLSKTAEVNAEARLSLSFFTQNAKFALLNSIRGAVWEQQILEGRILPTPKILVDPRAEYARLIKLRDIMSGELSHQKGLLQRPDLDLATRKRIMGNNIELENIIRQISEGQPQDLDISSINNLTEVEIDNLSDSAIRDLSPEAQDALLKRLESTQNISGSGVSGEF